MFIIYPRISKIKAERTNKLWFRISCMKDIAGRFERSRYIDIGVLWIHIPYRFISIFFEYTKGIYIDFGHPKIYKVKFCLSKYFGFKVELINNSILVVWMGWLHGYINFYSFRRLAKHELR
jgi:hypothetical protein